MKILIASGGSGGPATYTKILERELPQCGIEVESLNFQDVIAYPIIIRHLFFLFKLIKRGRGVDAIYSLDAATVGLPSLIATTILRKPFFIKIVGDFVWEQGVQRFGIDDSLDEYLVKKEQPLIVRFLRWGQKFIAGRAKKIIVPSNYLKNVVLSWGIREENIVVVYNAFEEDAIASISVENKKISGKIISIGRMVPWKGFNALIYTILNLKKYMDISLVIAGDGPDRKKIENLIVENNLSSVVKLLGNIEKNKLREEIVSSELFVLNTGYEGFSHSLLEVMNLEVPVITTNVGGNPEIVENGVDGILVPYNDTSALEQAIQSLFKDKVKMQTIAKNGKEKVKQFNLEKMIKNTILVLK